MTNYWPRRKGHKPIAQIAPQIRWASTCAYTASGSTTWDGKPLCTCGHPRDVRIHQVPAATDEQISADERRAG